MSGKWTATVVMAVWLATGAWAEDATLPATGPAENQKLQAALKSGMGWLTKSQNPDGSWGSQYPTAITSLACLSYLAADDEPFEGESGKVLTKALEYLLSQQKDGNFNPQNRNWIHTQGFATLALSEAYGRSLLCKTKPDLDAKKVKDAVAAAVKVIADNQSDSGGWWYTPGSKSSHEGSTTVCAVQALVSASNFGIEIDTDVLDKGFAYLKKCQNNDGGFDYQLDNNPAGASMQAGTAGNVSTLSLMKKFDQTVMMNAYKYLLKVTPAGIGRTSFPYYGHFYGCMGMKLLGEEIKPLREGTADYVAGVQKELLAWMQTDGSWLPKETSQVAYSTAFATLTLSVPDGRLSIFSRKPPKLPSSENK